jgi:NAD(P)-dependent dehydrogenase (short-subunit alcohol dehydrogenase family)
MAEGLEGKFAVVTGGASGIGLATVHRLNSEGVTCAVVDLHPPSGAAGDLYVEADVGDPAEWPTIVEQVEARFGGIDIAHLNAGVTTGEASVEAITDEQYRRIMHVNADGVFYGVRAMIPALARRGGGQIVCTASLAGLMGTPPDPVYAMTKHAVVGLVRSIGSVLEGQGIRINAVNPGFADTPMIADAKAAFEQIGFPLLRPEDVAHAVVCALTSGRSGECWVVQPGREPEPYKFAGIPGPRAAGKEGMPPPEMWG